MAYFIWDAEESLSFKEHFFSSAIKIFDMQNLSDTMDKWLNSRLNLEEENALEKFLKAPGQHLWNQKIFKSHRDRITVACRISEWLHQRSNILATQVKEEIYYPFVECFYDLAKEDAESQPEILNYACRFWITILIDPKNKCFDSPENDREEKVKTAIYKNPKTRELYPFLGEPLNRRPIVQPLAEWFLKRYDLKTAKHLSDFLTQKETQAQMLLSTFGKRERVQKLLHHKCFLRLFGRLCDKFSKKAWFQRYLKKSGKSNPHSEAESAGERLGQQALLKEIIHQTDKRISKLRIWVQKYIYWLVLSYLIVLSPVFIFSDESPFAPTNSITVTYSQVENGWSVKKEKKYELSTTTRLYYFFRVLTCFAYAFVISKMVEVLWVPTRMKLLMPRLICATFLGYLVLIVGDEVWEYAVTVEPLIRGVIIAGTLTFASLYLRSEIGNVIGFNSPQKKRVVWKRTFAIFRKGILRALVFGLILMDLFCMQFLQHLEPDAINHAEKHLFTGFLGVIEWRVGLLFSCVAFLIGIFAQIFWEDKPITEPL